MAKRYPADVVEVFVERTNRGFLYNGRGKEGRIIYQSPRPFRSRFDLQKQVRQRWPGVRIIYQ